MQLEIHDVVHAIQEDESVKEPLVRILELGSIERQDALRRLAMTMKSRQAPQELIDVIMSLQKTDLAEQVLLRIKEEDKEDCESISFIQKVKSFFCSPANN